MTLIATATLTTTGAFSFDNIPQTFTDLKLMASFRTNQGSNQPAFTRFNGDLQTTTHATRTLTGNGSSASSSNDSGNTGQLVGMGIGTDYTANTFNNLEIYISNYAGSTQKSFSMNGVTENNATASRLTITAGLFQSTNAITRVWLDSFGSTLIAGSTVSLYGITKGSDGIVTTS
jgi:hypothetical protein